jgi:hypothetical protein
MVDVQGTQSTVTLRSGRPTDTTACGRICYEAFEAIARQHNFAPDFPSVEITGHKTRSMYRRYRIVDERDLRGKPRNGCKAILRAKTGRKSSL